MAHATRSARRAAAYAARQCLECGKPGLEPSYNNIRRIHVACLKARTARYRPPPDENMIRVRWSRYRLAEADLLRLLAWQNDSCPCGEPFGSARQTTPQIDHDHGCCPGSAIVKTCGRCIRGLLHGPCNRLVGVIESNPDVIKPRGWVAAYLARPPYQQMRAAADLRSA